MELGAAWVANISFDVEVYGSVLLWKEWDLDGIAELVSQRVAGRGGRGVRVLEYGIEREEREGREGGREGGRRGGKKRRGREKLDYLSHIT